MIDTWGNLRCDGCGTILGADLEANDYSAKVKIVCHRSRCHHINFFKQQGEVKKNTGALGNTIHFRTPEIKLPLFKSILKEDSLST